MTKDLPWDSSYKNKIKCLEAQATGLLFYREKFVKIASKIK